MDLYRKIGIDPPRGVLLYGPPGELTDLAQLSLHPYILGRLTQSHD